MLGMGKGMVFVCQQCGHESSKWLGKCPSCSSWASFIEYTSKAKNTKSSKRSDIKESYIKDVPEDKIERTSTGVGELDMVLGGGMVPGQAILIAGEPGIGKSTLLLQLAENVGDAFYVAGEESVSQIKVRADRMGLALAKVAFLESTDLDDVIYALEKKISNTDCKAIIVDSVQTMYTENISSVPGSVGQVRETAFRFIDLAKKTSVPVILIGHVTKDGSVAGPATLSHMVDTVLWFEGDRLGQLRLLRPIKNRFGATGETGIFQMSQSGLEAVKDSDSLFVDVSQKSAVPGSVISCVMEGTRAIMVEIQCLVVPTKLAFPRRVVHGIDSKKAELLIAVLSKHCGLKLAESDVFISVVGDIKIKDPGVDLAIAYAIASSYKNKVVGHDTLVIGELGLLGEIRQARDEKKRLNHARRQNIKKSITHEDYSQIASAIKAL